MLGLRRYRIALTAAVVALQLACEPQAEPGFDGVDDPSLPTIKIHVSVGQFDEAVDELYLFLAWYRDGQYHPVLLFTDAGALADASPLGYELPIREPPPREFLHDVSTWKGGVDHEPWIGIGYVAATTAIEDLEMWDAHPSHPVGLAHRYMVVYSDRDIVPRSVGAERFGGPLRQGFNLVEFADSGTPGCDEDSPHCIVPARKGLNTVLVMKLVRSPNWQRPGSDFPRPESSNTPASPPSWAETGAPSQGREHF